MTPVAPKEVYFFTKMLKDIGNSSGAHKLSISSKELEPLVDEYEIALISLKGSVRNEIKEYTSNNFKVFYIPIEI